MRYLIIFLILSNFNSLFAQKTFPQFNDYGGVFPVPEAEILVNPDQKYKIVCDITQASKDPTKDMNHAFESVARIFNLFGQSGVKKENLDMVVVIHFEATPTILTDESFHFLYKTNNPNTDVINKLADAGVKFYVCGQSLRARKLVDMQKNKNIRVAHGALLALTHFQSLGYSLLKF